MQKILPVAAVLMMFLGACDNTLDLTAPWKDIPVVYGILSQADTAHYVRIEKAYLDPNRSALEIARIPDSLYYDNVEAQLVDVVSGRIIPLEEIDATTDGYPREDGVFAEEPNILFKVTADEAALVPGQKYRLEIRRGDSLPVVTAETTIVAQPTIIRPRPGDKLRFQSNNFYRVAWTEPESAAFYDVNLYIHFAEFNVADPGNAINRTVIWKLSGIVTSDEVQVLGTEFYEFMRGALVVDPALRRTMQTIDVEVRAGGAELYEFQRVTLANSGITSAGGDIPQYTNISEGVGVFSSSNRSIVPNLTLHEESLDSLRNGSVTAPLNFQ